MISLVGLKCKLLLGFELLRTKFLDLGLEHGLCWDCGIHTTGFDTYDEMTTFLQEVMCVDGNDTSLIGLGHVGEHDIDHTDNHTILQRMTRILDDRHDVRSYFSHVDEITSASRRELHRVDAALGANNI